MWKNSPGSAPVGEELDVIDEQGIDATVANAWNSLRRYSCSAFTMSHEPFWSACDDFWRLW